MGWKNDKRGQIPSSLPSSSLEVTPNAHACDPLSTLKIRFTPIYVYGHSCMQLHTIRGSVNVVGKYDNVEPVVAAIA